MLLASKTPHSSPFTPHFLSAPPFQPFTENLLDRRRELRTHVGIADLAQRFRLSRVRMNDRRQYADALLRADRQSQFADHFAGMPRNDRAAEDPAGFLV